ncbi:hypothetical protein N9043_00135 [bacterium]|nr:hypothetical protein [bacterium]
MPYTQNSVVDSFHWLNNAETNSVEFKRLLDSNKTFFNVKPLPDNFEMWKVVDADSNFVIALVSMVDERVIYYIKCETWDDIVLRSKPVTQLKLWRTIDARHQSLTSGLPALVFSKLLDEYNVVASDGVHTYSGKRFWQQELSRAIYSNLFVYRYDVISSDLTRLDSSDGIADNAVDLWGDDEKYMNVLAIISKESLTNRAF